MSDENQQPPVNDQIQSIKIEDEMRGAYLDYAMSVIVGRALPDVRDGLKPVHRRALFAMYDLNNTHDRPYLKSARVVGDVIGKYPPHGDSAVYDTIVRMAQDFSMRYPLVDGQGNFGSIDGDSAAAMRYTEIRMEKVTAELLSDIEKETVDFGPNYDGSLSEPLVLPSRVPTLLVNGSSGIAVGMATNIPPHNLREVVDAALALIQDQSLDTHALLNYVSGPDFPTSGIVIGGQGLKKAYLTGKGIITIRGRAEVEVLKNDRERIIITELPYQVNKVKLIEKIVDLVKNKKIEGISDLRDESDREGIRVVIEMKKGESGTVLLNQLYKFTQLQDSFGITFLALHQNRPKIFDLRGMIWSFIEHRKDVVLRRTAYELKKAEARAHILEGLKIAVENIDEVIAMIKAAPGPVEARIALMGRFSLTEKQAQAVLDMRLHRLTGLERDKIIQEYQTILELISKLKSILASEALVYEIVETELKEVREKYGDDRKTEIILDETQDFEIEDLVKDEEVVVTITRTGYIKRSDPSEFRAQHRGGRGIVGMDTSEDDQVTSLFVTRTHSTLLCFTNRGRVFGVPVYKVPMASRTSKGRAVVNLIRLQPEEKMVTILPVDRKLQEFKDADKEALVFISKQGYIKRTALSEFSAIRASGLNGVQVPEDDELLSVRLTSGDGQLLIATRNGFAIRFNEADARLMGRTARGVIGIRLTEGDEVVSLETIDPNEKDPLGLVATENGMGRRLRFLDFPLQGRGGKGVVNVRTDSRTGKVVALIRLSENDHEVMLVSSNGNIIRCRADEINLTGRGAKGVILMRVSEGEKLVAIDALKSAPEQ